jgi:uncharacterized protein YndB with AHSA1/START domain
MSTTAGTKSTTADVASTDLSNAPLGEVTVVDDTLQIVFRRHLRFPVEKVWAALTTPERLADWFANAEVDLRVGGILRLDGNGMHQDEMRIMVCEPPRSFALAWKIGPKESLVRFDLTPEADGCTLTLTHSGVPMMAAAARAGWHALLEALPDAVEGRATPWEVKRARETALRAIYPSLQA